MSPFPTSTGILAAAILCQNAHAQDAGLPGCPCIGIPDSVVRGISYTDTTGTTCLRYTSASSNASYCYPRIYGALQCQAWDHLLPPYCADVTSTPQAAAPRSCTQLWCYVNHTTCTSHFSPSTMFPGSGMHYSYATCGSIDFFATELLVREIHGRSFRVGIPGPHEPLLFTDRTLAHNPSNIPDGLGIIPDFMFRIAEAGGFRMLFQDVSAESRKLYNSSYTACVHDVAVGKADLCIAGFLETSYRRSLALFPTTYFTELYYLMAPVKPKQGFIEALGGVFRPFAPELWAVILASSLAVGFCMWFFGELPGAGVLTGTLQGLHKAAAKFMGFGDFDPVTTRAGSVLVFGWGFLCVIGMSTYTANLATFLVLKEAPVPYRSFEEAVQRGVKICTEVQMIPDIVGRYPGAEAALRAPLVDPSTATSVAQSISREPDNCEAIVIPETTIKAFTTGYAPFDELGTICNLIKIGDPVIGMPKGFPCSEEFARALGYLAVLQRNEGGWTASAAGYPYPESPCPPLTGIADEARSMGLQDLLGAMVITAAWLAMACGCHVYERHAGKLGGARAVEGAGDMPVQDSAGDQRASIQAALNAQLGEMRTLHARLLGEIKEIVKQGPEEPQGLEVPARMLGL